MDARMRSNLGAGVVMILIGAALLLAQLTPDWYDWLNPANNWPMIVIGVGLLLLIMGLMIGAPAMAVPACIVGGVGGLLYWQNVTGNWDSWAYAWGLIPGFVGVGIILAGMLGGGVVKAVREGIKPIAVSLLLVSIFGSFLGADDFQAPVWPIGLIAAGLLYLVQSFTKER